MRAHTEPKHLRWLLAASPLCILSYRLVAFIAVLGPGFVTANVDNDPSVVEKGIGRKDLNLCRVDVILGCVVTDVVAFSSSSRAPPPSTNPATAKSPMSPKPPRPLRPSPGALPPRFSASA